MKKKAKLYVYPFILFSFLTLSLNFLSLGGVQISIAFLFLLTIILLPNLSRKNILISGLIMIYVLFIGLTQIMYLDTIEFLKTLLLLLFAVLFFTSALSCNVSNIKKELLIRTLKVSSLLIVTFEVIQVIELTIFKSDNLLFALDNFSISTAESSERFQAVNLLWYIRPLSFYHEPSYLSSVLIIHSLCLHLLGNEKFTQILIFFGIILSISITGYLFYLIFLLYAFNLKYKLAFKVVLPILLILLTLYQYELILEIFRLDEILLKGSSAWARIMKPFLEIKYEIQTYYSIFGRALGNTRIVYDNSLFVLIAYFGLLTPLILLLPIHFIYKKYGLQKTVIFIIAFGNLLFLNGAILTPESMFLLIIIIICIRLNNQKAKNIKLA